MLAHEYAELHCWSNFSFLEGASHPEEVANAAAQAGLKSVALTDRDGLYGMVRFSRAASWLGIGGIVGAELTFADEHERPRLVLLVEDLAGYHNLVELISLSQMRGSKGDARLEWGDLQGRTAGLVALSGSRHGVLEQALIKEDHAEAVSIAGRLRDLFGERLYIELQHHLRPEDAALINAQLAFAKTQHVPVVATNGVVYAYAADAKLADILLCVKQKTTLARAHEALLLRPNAEYFLKTPQMMARLFSALPHALRNSMVIAERCAFRLEKLTGQFPLFPVPPQETSRQSYLRTLVYRGAAERYGTPLRCEVERQLEYELGMIAKMDLAGYFLIVWDIVRAAAELGVLCQGRGSAANSAVCYSLGITAVDPIGMNLLFERFMSEGREEIPDIDIDFAHEDREKVIQYVYERYGRAHAAMAAEVVTYRTRSAIRDVGKALGLSLDQVQKVVDEFDARESLAGATGVADRKRDELPQSVARRRDLDASTMVRGSRLEKPPLGHAHEYHGFDGWDYGDNPDPHIAPPVDGRIGEWLFAFCRRIDGFPRHMGIHSGGMVITRDPLIRVAPVEWATMRDRTIVQWDKDDLQDLGLIKIDLLGLGMLSLLREAFSLYKRVQTTAGGPPDLALHTIPADDKATYVMMQKADTIGVFQIESRAQQSMLPRMKPACFYDIVMQVAIIRPGPIQGDMIHPFLRRRNGMEKVTYPHPKLQPVLERTLGVPLFQEQGMRMAIEAAGFTPAQADQLRRAMGHKRSHERMREIYPKLVQGMVDNGIERSAAEQLFHMLEGFADYGFPESHAASFALLAYASAYVKCHYPAIFAAAILNVQPMGFYSTEVLVNDARRHGVVIKPVEVNASEYYSFVDESGALRLGFHLIRGLGEAQQLQLEAAVQQGHFAGIVEFAQRTKLSKEALENLAIAGAFAPWFRTRRQAMWALRGLDERQTRGELGKLMDLEEPPAAFKKLSERQETTFDLWSTGVSPKGQPMEHFREFLTSKKVVPARQLERMQNHTVCRVGGLVITRQRPGTAKGFVFLTLEDETGYVNVIVRPDIYEEYRRVIRQSMTLIIEGTLQKEQGCIDVLAKRFWHFEAGEMLEGMRSRNFH